MVEKRSELNGRIDEKNPDNVSKVNFNISEVTFYECAQQMIIFSVRIVTFRGLIFISFLASIGDNANETTSRIHPKCLKTVENVNRASFLSLVAWFSISEKDGWMATTFPKYFLIFA